MNVREHWNPQMVSEDFGVGRGGIGVENIALFCYNLINNEVSELTNKSEVQYAKETS